MFSKNPADADTQVINGFSVHFTKTRDKSAIKHHKAIVWSIS